MRAMRKSGHITFARFMELALYCPVYGYYEKEKDTAGRRGDFFTSVSVGSAFGELLAFQFARWLAEARDVKSRIGGSARPAIRIIESGAHDGKLAADILLWLREHRPSLLAGIRYGIIEPSPLQQARQRKTLSGFGEKIFWTEDWKGLRRATGGIRGIIFSNELLDAMPVHRLGWDAAGRSWFEWGVARENDRFAWTRIRNPAGKIPLPELSPELLETLPDGFTTETCPAAAAWWSNAAGALREGKLMTVDYGLTDEEIFTPERSEGTLRGYHRHRLVRNLLARPGEQDLTAHVNFTKIQSVGEESGLRTEAFIRQENFLVRIAEQIWREENGVNRWTPDRRRQFQTLIHPQHLGRKFRVLIQSRG
jgi:SAM-dependent MidA family methyltransferase